MQLLKQSTAATTIVGPILDSTGAVYTGAVIGDLNITKNGTTAAMAAAATLTHDHNGHYLLVFTTGNTDTLGRMDITCNKTAYAMPPKVFEVVAAAVFDTLVTNGTLASMTSGRTLVVDAAGVGDANMVTGGPTGSGVALNANTVTHFNTIFDTDYATVYDTTNKAFLAKLGNFAMGGSSLALTTGAIACTTITASGAVAFQSTFTVTGALTASGVDIGLAVTNIPVTGAALNAIAGARILNTGTETSGTYASTQLLDGISHVITAVGGVINVEYTGTLPNTSGQVTGLLWKGYLAGLGNVAAVYFWNWNTSAYEQVEQINGISGTPTIASETEVPAIANNNHTGTGGTWKVKISGSAMTLGVLNTDLLSIGYAVVPTYQSGDSFALIGATGSGLTSLAPSATALSTVQWTNGLATNLGTLAGHDPGATLGTSTLTQAQVTGGAYDVTNVSCLIHLAASQHVIVDSGTVTTLTNLPSIPANWLTAAGIASGALNGKGDWMLSYTQPTGFLAANFTTGIPVSGDLSSTMKTSVQTAADAAITANATIVEIEAETDGIAAIPTSNPTANEIADAVLGRGVGNVEDTADAHSLVTLILGTTEYKIENNIWHIYKTDGVTLFVDKTLTTTTEGHITAVT